MAAYFVVDLGITDPAGFEEYRRVVPPLVAKYGGRHLARDAPMHRTWAQDRLSGILEYSRTDPATKAMCAPLGE